MYKKNLNFRKKNLKHTIYVANLLSEGTPFGGEKNIGSILEKSKIKSTKN